MNKWVLAGAVLIGALMVWALMIPTKPLPGAKGSQSLPGVVDEAPAATGSGR